MEIHKHKKITRWLAVFMAAIVLYAMPSFDALANQQFILNYYARVTLPAFAQMKKTFGRLYLGSEPLPKIGISAGHGGNTGASVMVNGKRVYEDTLNLDVALAANKAFTAKGYPTLMNRMDNSASPKDEKLALFRPWKPEVYLEFHFNIGGTSSNPATGLEVWYKEGDAEGKRLAEILARKLSASVGIKNRGAKTGINFYICNAFPLGVLIECGFLNNANDRAKFNSALARQKFAQATLEAVEEFLNVQNAKLAHK
ncbi:MAG: N-acetylmuramoyl-L-alanine amidase [Oscillospiraceae bacterium]|nr:N-acetylmuramoyl-L-alanine amidase [Oscillospiraceae bacterium]